MIYLALALILLAIPVDAATLYVNNSGTPSCSDATVKASNSAGSPWCTIGRAAWGNAVRASADASQAAAAGDIVLITAGTYSAAGQNSKNNSAFNPVNSGSAGNYITFRAVGTVNLQLSSSVGAVIGCLGVDYIKWIGFTVDEQFATPHSDMGPVVGDDSDGCWFESNIITGYQYGHNEGDNHPGIRFELCNSCVAYNNTISNFYTCPSACSVGTPVNSANGAGIQVYASHDLIIEHNNISNSGSGVFIKGGATGVDRSLRALIRYNKIYNVYGGIQLSAAEDAQVYQNVIYTTTVRGGGNFWELVTSLAVPINCAVFNNTIVGALYGLEIRSDTHTGGVFQNNLITSPTSYAWYSETRASPGTVTSDRNHYYDYPTFSSFNGTTRTLAAWQSAFSLDANSVSSDPIFANAAGNDYRLCTGSGTPHASCSGASPALTTGRAYNNIGGTTGTTIAAGAYITGTETIGVESTQVPGSVVSGTARFVGAVRIQ